MAELRKLTNCGDLTDAEEIFNLVNAQPIIKVRAAVQAYDPHKRQECFLGSHTNRSVSMKEVYFDTNVYSHIRNRHYGITSADIARLKSNIERRKRRIYVSSVLLEETTSAILTAEQEALEHRMPTAIVFIMSQGFTNIYDKTKIARGDFPDVQHAVYASAVGTLVTHDDKFANLMKRVPIDGLEILNIHSLLSQL